MSEQSETFSYQEYEEILYTLSDSADLLAGVNGETTQLRAQIQDALHHIASGLETKGVVYSKAALFEIIPEETLKNLMDFRASYLTLLGQKFYEQDDLDHLVNGLQSMASGLSEAFEANRGKLMKKISYLLYEQGFETQVFKNESGDVGLQLHKESLLMENTRRLRAAIANIAQEYGIELKVLGEMHGHDHDVYLEFAPGCTIPIRIGK